MKRHEALVQLSRDHHFGLLANWKIKKGIAKNISAERISAYISKFYNEHLKTHFEEEEELVFPLLGNDDPLVKEALAQHQNIHRLAAENLEDYNALKTFGETLEQHIRFEERELFQKIQDSVPEEKLQQLLKNHHFEELKELDFPDEFWK